MKKRYAKPEILFEDFTMSSSIAVGCGTITRTFGEGVCAYQTFFAGKDAFIFTDAVTACTTKNAGEYNGVCYHVPNDAYDLFTS